MGELLVSLPGAVSLGVNADGTWIRHALTEDIPAIEALRRADKNCLGFVPTAKYEHITNHTHQNGRNRWKYEWLLVSIDNDDLTGFCLGGFHRLGCKMEQLAVRQDARRRARALLLMDTMENEARRRGCPRIRSRVAYDIEANFFWRAAGYLPVTTVESTYMNLRPSKSKRPLIVYDKTLDQQVLFPLSYDYNEVVAVPPR